MTVAFTVVMAVVMVVIGIWVLHRLGQQQREGIATHRFGRRLRPPDEDEPRLPVLPPSWDGDRHDGVPPPPPQAAMPDAVDNGTYPGDADGGDAGQEGRPPGRLTDHAVHLGGPPARSAR